LSKSLLVYYLFDINFTIFASVLYMRRYKVSEIIRLLEKDGWFLCYYKGDHRQFKHSEKKGKVTVRGRPNDTLSQFLLNSIWKQAG